MSAGSGMTMPMILLTAKTLLAGAVDRADVYSQDASVTVNARVDPAGSTLFLSANDIVLNGTTDGTGILELGADNSVRINAAIGATTPLSKLFFDKGDV